MEIWDVLREFGPAIALAVFVLFRDYKREDRLTTRIEKLEDEQRNTILPLVEKTTEVITHNTAVMMRLEAALDKRALDGKSVS